MAFTPLTTTAVEELEAEAMGEVAETIELFAPAIAAMGVASASDAVVPAASAVIIEPGGTTTTWSRGEGLDGTIYEPGSFEDLLDFIDDIEFKATIDTEDHVRDSHISGKAYFYDDNSNNRGQSSIAAWAEN